MILDAVVGPAGSHFGNIPATAVHMSAYDVVQQVVLRLAESSAAAAAAAAVDFGVVDIEVTAAVVAVNVGVVDIEVAVAAADNLAHSSHSAGTAAAEDSAGRDTELARVGIRLA